MLSVEDMCWLLIYYWQPEKMSLDKSLQIHGKSWKIILNSEGCSYRQLYKQGNEDRKKEENSEQQALKSNKLIPTRATTSHVLKLIIWQAVKLCKFIPFLKQNLQTDPELKPFLTRNVSFSDKLTSEFRFTVSSVQQFPAAPESRIHPEDLTF